MKSILISRIFLAGWFDADEWKDGILATSFRTFASLPENVSRIFFYFMKNILQIKIQIFIGEKMASF